MAANIITDPKYRIKLCSYNMHGFSNGLNMVKTLCQSYDIVLLQEHWLITNNLHKFNDIDSDFQHYSISSMDSIIASGILVGRPHGGVSVLYRKSLSNRIEILSHDDVEGRYLSLKLKCNPGSDIIITCVYFPCVTVPRDYLIASSSILAHIDDTVQSYSNARHIVAGDFNFDCKDGNTGFDMFKDIVADNNLSCCDGLFEKSNIDYTYYHETLSQYSWIDHFFVSSNLRDCLFNFKIIDNGANMSDHLPIGCEVDAQYAAYIGHCSKPTPPATRGYKERWDKADLLKYYLQSGHYLQSIVVPSDLLNCPTGCMCNSHKSLINSYYEEIIHMLKLSASSCVPKVPVNLFKAFWNENLDKLKEISIDMHNLWRMVGSPRSGIINSARLKAKFDYKQAIKQSECDFERLHSDHLNSLFNNKDTKNFWKSWISNYKKSSSTPVYINGHSDPAVIANSFRDHFDKVYVDSSQDLAAVDEFQCIIRERRQRNTSEAPCELIAIETIEQCINKLKPLKAAGHDGIAPEHLIHSHPCVSAHLKILFTLMLRHSFVPDSFGRGTLIPIVKDKNGDVGSLDNYRPITISPIVSKVFELFLIEKFSKYFDTDALQFGFKKNLGCSNAVLALRLVIDYFTARNSNVYIASLDACKAFDRVNHFKMFSILCQRGLPSYFVNIIVNWYGKLSVAIKWNGELSHPLIVKSGVRQGGVLSPILFNVYVNRMLTQLRSSDLGCRIHNTYIGCIMYADDLLLLSASVLDLQSMLNICGNIGSNLGIKFNSNKSACMIIGPNKLTTPTPMLINGASIQWINSLNYLGVSIAAGQKFSIDLAATRRKFFTCVNSILSNCKFTSDIVKLELMEKQCLPILLYNIECFNLCTNQLKDINSWWNSVYRKVFSYNKWESVKELIYLLGRFDIYRLIHLRKVLFLQRLELSTNTVMIKIHSYLIQSAEFVSLLQLYKVYSDWPVSKIKFCFKDYFRQLFA
jgi:exonuclease III